MTALVIRPCRRDDARAFVREHHSHHRGSTSAADCFRLAAFVGDERVAVAIMGEATAPAYGNTPTWEITRLCCGPHAPKYTASRLLGACGRVMDAAGIDLGISYCRVDEYGSSYRAAGWIPVAYVKGRTHDTGNRRTRTAHAPSTEIIDRVRWERGPNAPSRASNVSWDGTFGPGTAQGMWIKVAA